jgi:L-lactate dehydrogenase complex protein LldG
MNVEPSANGTAGILPASASVAAESGPATNRAVDAFLRSLPGAWPSDTGPTTLPEVRDTARQVSPSDDLVALYVQRATAVGLHVHQVAPANWIDAIRAILRSPEFKARAEARGTKGAGAEARGSTLTVLVCAQAASALTDARAAELIVSLRADGIESQTTPNDGLLFSVDASITGVSAAIAETGTIVCPSGPGLARGASLIPPVHIAVVSVEQLLPDLYDYLAAFNDVAALPTNANLITGPSKTADIEGILITGVHGPGDVHVVLLGS